jgi:hypothetical protein
MVDSFIVRILFFDTVYCVTLEIFDINRVPGVGSPFVFR